MWGRVFVVVLLGSIAWTGVARAEDGESGHFTVEVGTSIAEDGRELVARAFLRSEVAFRLAGPLSAGGFLQAIVPEDPMGSPPGFGAGVLLALRPELPLLGFVPHLELTGARVQLPGHAQTLVDAWSIGLGGGVGAALSREIALEARVHHQWWLAMTPRTSLADHAWSVAVALTVDLP